MCGAVKEMRTRMSEDGNEKEEEEGVVSHNGNPKTPKTVAKTTDKPISDAIILSPYLPLSVSMSGGLRSEPGPRAMRNAKRD